jgi:hypothetical protein
MEEPLDIRPRTDAPFPQLEVRNPVHQTRYLVLLPAYPSHDVALCTCTDFARRAIGTCKHIEAAWIWLADHPEPLPIAPTPNGTQLWSQIDYRLRSGTRQTGPPSLELRRPGALLFETDAGAESEERGKERKG